MGFIQADREVVTCGSYEALIEETTKRILEASQIAISSKGIFNLALSGGMTCRGVYSNMSSTQYREEFDWNNIHFFWTNDRWVPAENPKSNYGLVAEVLLTRADIPIENIHPIKTNVNSPKESALLYDKVITNHFKLEEGAKPSFDLILLGLGRSGSVASLFPDHEAIVEKKRLVVSVKDRQVDEKRVTMTFPLINQAQKIMVLAAGKERTEVLKKVLKGSFLEDGLPAQLLEVPNGSIVWLTDSALDSPLSHD